ncbi:MAG: phage integrase N-terminal SAM-like domain-containing protein [Candidatus Scalindua sp.]|nr:phage integrase N-terminal SAM-like domain-containing protein [Candidatus Scalindua sp.]
MNHEQTNNFLTHLSRTRENWQIKQADNALRLYAYFLSSFQKATSGKSLITEKEWNILETKTRNILRLKHLSYSTEKTYISWLRTFSKFVNKKKPSELISGDIQGFLSFLAVERKVSPYSESGTECTGIRLPVK